MFNSNAQDNNNNVYSYVMLFIDMCTYAALHKTLYKRYSSRQT